MDDNGNYDRGQHGTLWHTLVRIQRVAICDPTGIGGSIDTFVQSLPSCAIEGNKIPDTAPDLETENDTEQDVEAFHETIFLEDSAEESMILLVYSDERHRYQNILP